MKRNEVRRKELSVDEVWRGVQEETSLQRYGKGHLDIMSHPVSQSFSPCPCVRPFCSKEMHRDHENLRLYYSVLWGIAVG